MLIVKADNEAVKAFGDLKGLRAAQSLTSNFGRLAQENGAELVATDGFDQSIQLVLQGRADATINDSLSFLDFRKKQPNAPVRVAAELEDAEYSGILMRQGQDDLVAAVNAALADIKTDGTYQAIADKYFGADVSQ